MLREIAAPFRAIVPRPTTTPVAATNANRAAREWRRMAPASPSALALLLAATLLCGCGIKGPLRPPPPAAVPPAATPADAGAAPAPSETPSSVDPSAKSKP